MLFLERLMAKIRIHLEFAGDNKISEAKAKRNVKVNDAFQINQERSVRAGMCRLYFAASRAVEELTACGFQCLVFTISRVATRSN